LILRLSILYMLKVCLDSSCLQQYMDMKCSLSYSEEYSWLKECISQPSTDYYFTLQRKHYLRDESHLLNTCLLRHMQKTHIEDQPSSQTSVTIVIFVALYFDDP